MSSRSKPRKHGKYLHGRPWPRACPVCRSCGNGAPSHFYNSRGLCNVCHKTIRSEGRDALEAWEPLPSEANDKSWSDLHRNPSRWLQKYMTGDYARPFIETGRALAEAERLFQSIVDRWYGVEALPSVAYDDTPADVVVWSTAGSWEADEPAPLGKSADQVREDAQRHRDRRVERRRFQRWWEREGAETVLAPGVTRPSIHIDDGGYILEWRNAGLTLAAMGPVGGVPTQLVVVHGVDITIFPFDREELRLLVQTLMS